MTGRALRLLVPAAVLLLAVACNPKQARAEKAVTAYRTLLAETIRFNQAFKSRPELKEEPNFVVVLDQNIDLLEKEKLAVDQFVKDLKEDPLLQKITSQTMNMEQLPTFMRYSLGVNGIPTTRYSKHEKLVILWTDEMGVAIQPRVNEIRKIASAN